MQDGAFERHLAGRHLIKHRAKRKQIGAAVKLLATDLLGRHVSDRAQHGSGTGEVLRAGVCGHSLGSFCGFSRDFGETEVKHLGVASSSNEDVRGLDVAVNDSFGVGGIQRVGNLDAERKNLINLQGMARDAVLQRHAIEEFHGDERVAVVLSDFVDSADVGVIKRRGGARLATEALQGLRVLGHLVRQELESDEAAELGVFGLVNDAHAASAELFEDAVVGDGGADHEEETKRWLMIGRLGLVVNS